MVTIVKKDIVLMISDKTGLSKDKTTTVVDALFKSLTEILIEANPEVRIEIRRFGVLGVKKTKAKPAARNLHTNEVIYVPPHRKTFFKLVSCQINIIGL